jgi:hypothetical protein
MRRVARWIAGLALALGAWSGSAQTRTLVAYAGSYAADSVYSVNDMVSVGSEFYISLAANNKGNTPGASAAEWALVGAASGVAGPQGATGAAGPQGPEGPAGPAGPQGVAGVPGAAGAAGPMGPAGPVGATGAQGAAGTAGVAAETRTFSVAHLKCYNVMAGSSLTLFSATGPGNVERIQIAAGYNSGSPALAPIAANTLLTIAVDGQTYTATLGMFLLWNGYTTSDGVAATNDLFVTKYLGITSATSLSNETISGYRRIYIKYNTSINISLTVPAASGSSVPGNIVWWTQVEYYPGVAPAGRYPATRNVFHMVTHDWGPIAPSQTLTVLPAIAGAGELESIYFVSSAPGKVEPQWLEANPILTVDGTEFHYGGTEDFFGNQFYGDQWRGRADEYGIARDYASAAPDNTTYWSGYRYFRESPMVFNNSLGMTWSNVAGDGGPAAQVGALAVYYTTQ